MIWKKDYEIGIDIIDQQHQEIFQYISNFIAITQGISDRKEKLDQIKESMTFIKESITAHLEMEETYQEKMSYPNIEQHKKVHAQFKKELSYYINLCEKQKLDVIKSQEFGTKLMTWLIMHICQMDQEIGQYIKCQKGILK